MVLCPKLAYDVDEIETVDCCDSTSRKLLAFRSKSILNVDYY